MTDEPEESERHNEKQTLHALGVSDFGLFPMQAAAFEVFETSFNPSA
ncbi:MAG: hypothetical protein K8L97_07360 [Anaerolineae bacterium]|nr:hypothetical protein [Anaerolineae bacterium]